MTQPAPDESALREAHAKLLGEYVTVLNLLPKRGEDGHRSATLLAHLHMRGRLNLVRHAYLQIAQTLAGQGVASYREWLKDAAEGLNDMTDTLIGWRRPGIVALIPLAIGIYSNLLNEITLSTLVVAVVVGYSLFFGLLTLPVLWEGFHIKRRLFTQATGDPAQGRNVYEAENTLFSLVNREKPLEATLDHWILVAPVMLLVYLPPFAIGCSGRTGLKITGFGSYRQSCSHCL